MDETVKNEVSGEIENQGEDTQKSPMMLKLEKYRITPEKQLPKMDLMKTAPQPLPDLFTPLPTGRGRASSTSSMYVPWSGSCGVRY